MKYLTKSRPSHQTRQIDPSSYANRALERRCSELREELLSCRAAALKENGTLSRKLEALAREKRELSKRLAISNKENRAAKHQMEELLSERAVLLARLDGASKEFKANTRSKKAALDKLEEAQATIEKLEMRLEQVTRDKEVLERKLRAVEQEFGMGNGGREEGGKYGVNAATTCFLDRCVQTEVMLDKREHAVDRGEQVDNVEIVWCVMEVAVASVPFRFSFSCWSWEIAIVLIVKTLRQES